MDRHYLRQGWVPRQFAFATRAAGNLWVRRAFDSRARNRQDTSVPLHITSVEIYEAAVLRISELKEAAEGTSDETDLIALVDAMTRWESDRGLPAKASG